MTTTTTTAWDYPEDPLLSGLLELIAQARRDFLAEATRQLDEIFRSHGLNPERPEEVASRVRKVDLAGAPCTIWFIDDTAVAYLVSNDRAEMVFSTVVPPSTLDRIK